MQSATTNPVRWTTYDLQIFEGDRVNRYEIIDGELFVTRAPDWKHQAVCINIGTVLKLWSDESGLGQPAVTPGIVFSESDNVIPDIVWASKERLERLLDEAGHLTAAPELVVEVLSPGKANERRDREAKLKLYSVLIHIIVRANIDENNLILIRIGIWLKFVDDAAIIFNPTCPQTF
ncbi:Uma2 family endonuclease [Scytonema sp. UIC 10036]|uniref:Uma2 family endonuclease n=1 Tax=Scytonema sp. UIC 10036 TaxID=2304196 RepID=UPI001FAA1BF4|nr:Uma2 family endonuclease [Scytonema sp. UIC 10036]